MAEQRPDPDKLLQRVQEEARKEQRGRLKIYLGAAPGVGKTHEMLQDALQEHAKGLDVAIGVAESHGRKEIDALLKDFEILPKQKMAYRGRDIYEFDLDAALKRRPGLILMDEMAHTNAPGLRHAKRWQDIKELLDRGINVYTTLNVQHIESLSDNVAQIIHAPIQEIVPDSMIEMADAIELVDLPPEELLKRLKEGKVYIPEQAALATEHFFRKGNLNALRELALRVTAERVDAEVLTYRQGEGIKYVWPTSDKILVCVGPKPESVKLIRAAKRMANSLQASWIAVYVDTSRFQSEKLRNDAIQNLHIAERLGAETHVLSGTDIVKEVVNFAREQNVTQIMIWKHIYTRWRDLFRRNLADELVRASGEIDVYIMTGIAANVKQKSPAPSLRYVSWKEYILATGIILFATAINFALYSYLTFSVIMIYLLAVTIVALFGRTGPSILATFMSVAFYDYFFFPPFLSFSFMDIQYALTLIVMLLIAQVISHLTIQTRKQTESARLLQRQTSQLYTLSRQLSSTRGVSKLIETGTRFIADMLDSQVLAILPVNHHLEVYGNLPPSEQALNDKEQAIASWVYELGQSAGFGTNTLTFSKALYIPLLTPHGAIGVLRIMPNKDQLFTPEQMRFLEACANQIALALDVDRLHGK